MGLQEEHDKYVESLKIGEQETKQRYPELFKNYRKEPVTAETIVKEGEQPLKNAGELLGMIGRVKYASVGSKIAEANRARTIKHPFTGGNAPLIDVNQVKSPKVNLSTKINDIFNHKIYKNVGNAVKSGFEEIVTTPGRIIDTAKTLVTGGPDIGTAKDVSGQGDLFEHAKLVKYQKEMRNTNIPQRIRTDMALSVKGSAYKTSEPFDVFKFREQTKYMKDKGRRFLSIFQAGMTNYGASRAASFETNQPILTSSLKEDYKYTNLPETSFQVHHRAALKAIMGAYHGLDIGSPMFNKVTDIILQEIPWLGLGDNPENWMGIIGSTSDRGTPHHLAHKYYNKIIGPSGELIFDKPTIDRMMVDEEFRLEMAKEIGRVIRNSDTIVTQATKLWETGFSNKKRFKTFDALVNHLSQFDELGYNALSNPEYEAGVITDIITQIAIDPSMVPTDKPEVNLKKKSFWEGVAREDEFKKEQKASDKSIAAQKKDAKLDAKYPNRPKQKDLNIDIE